ncbi:MAG: PTS sugar transporter subunit IIA, partial [Alkalispirochaeta sp.]
MMAHQDATILPLIPDGQALLRTVVLSSSAKDEAIRELAEYAAEHIPGMSAEEIAARALEREALATSGVADEIAFPHA